MSIGFPDIGVEETAEEKRLRRLSEQGAPSTCLVPRDKGEVERSDWLLSFLDYNDDFCVLFILESGLISLIALFTLLPVTLSHTLSSGIGFPICAGLGAYVFLGFYTLGLIYGQIVGTNFIAQAIVERRVNRIRRRELKKAVKQANALDARGWRPREGIPHPKGREDLYDRCLVETHVLDGELAMGLRCWSLWETPAERGAFWHPEPNLKLLRWFANNSEGLTELAEYRATLEAEAKKRDRAAEASFNQMKTTEQLVGEANNGLTAISEHVNKNALVSV